MKTIIDIAKMVAEKEAELAYGSETPVLGAFVNDFGYVSDIIAGEDMTVEDREFNGFAPVDYTADMTDAYHVYEQAYIKLEAGAEDIW